jgi:biopolymer transport protein ExbD
VKFNWDDEPDLNITPFVDVMLVLMSILMVTAPTMTYQEQIELPQGTQSKEVSKESTITVVMEKNRRISLYLNGKKKDSFTNVAEFNDNLMLITKKYGLSTTVFIRADKNLKYGSVTLLLKSLKDVGFSKVSLITE